tara:strand:- start:1365 stop:2132 length:768 start_codon:yes stop_codon:yes gene_type:complete
MLNQIRKGKKYQLENLKEVLPDVANINERTKFIPNPYGVLNDEQRLIPFVHYVEDTGIKIWNGFRLDQKYELRYKMKNTGREISLGKFSGQEICRRTTHIYQMASKDEFKECVDELGIDYFVRKMTQKIVNAYAMSILDKKRFNAINKNPEMEDLSFIAKAHKNNRKGRSMKDWINNNICTHIVCCADITRDEDDCPWDIVRLTDTYGLDNTDVVIHEDRKEALFTLNGYLNDKELYDSIQETGVLEVAGKRRVA